MRTRYVSLLALLAVFVWAPGSALADTWGEPITTPDRFIVLTSFNNQAVFDKETGLVWEKSPTSTSIFTWFDAQVHCNNLTVGNRKGWRLPTIQELASLLNGPFLPAGHPFSNVQSTNYWSASTRASAPDHAWVMDFLDGFVGLPRDKALPTFGWCVRGGQGVDPQ